MPQLTQEDLSQGKLRCFVYGHTGVGKTRFCGSALEIPEMCPVLYCDFEDGRASIAGMLTKHWDNVAVWSMQSLEDMRMMARVLRSDEPEFRTVIIDSAPEWWSLLMTEHLEAQGLDQARIQDYGIVSDAILGVLRAAIRKHQLHLLVTCGEEVEKDEMTGGLYRRPGMTGQLAEKLPRLFDIVGYMEGDIKATKDGDVRTDTRTMQVQPFSRTRAKSRLPDGFPVIVPEPTMHIFWDAWVHRFDTIDKQ